MRVIRALHEVGAEAVAIYSTADEDSLHVPHGRPRRAHRPARGRGSYLNIPSVIAAGVTTGCEAVHPGWGFLAENPAFAEACADNDLVFVGPLPGHDGAHGRQGAREGRDARRERPARPGQRGAGRRRRGAAGRRGGRLPRAAEGGRRRRRARHAARRQPRTSSRRRTRSPRARRRRPSRTAHLRREGGRARAARGDPGARRLARRRAHARRARVLDPAAPPEADRGVAVGGAHARGPRGDGGGRRARVPAARLPQRRHVRVPARARRRRSTSSS